jgi:hypothetical protein
VGVFSTSGNYNCCPCPRFVSQLSKHAASYLLIGWTVFDKLYILKGVVYIVSDHRSSIPDVRFIYSKALFILEGKEAEQSRLPTQEDIRVISTKEAKKLFGTGAQIIDGVTVRSVSLFFFTFR